MALFTREEALEYHRSPRHGKTEVVLTKRCESQKDLSLAYSPGVAEACKAIAEDQALVSEYTGRANLVAVISDGTAVLGLGNIGPYAAKPVMEGKGVLFKNFADVDVFDLCLKTGSTEEFIAAVRTMEPTFGGINLEDISAPRCFEIEAKLKEKLDIPVFHDDQHGTAIVVGAAMLNAVKLAGKKLEDVTVVINGAGSAGIAIGKFLLKLGVGNLVMVDLCGILNRDDHYDNPAHAEMAQMSNKKNIKGGLADALRGADVFVGVSKPNLVTPEMVKSMAEKPILFPMANPEPEITYDLAKQSGAYIVGTGRSDYPNQINNVLVFPGVFKGALKVRAKAITEDMKLAAAHAIADLVTDDKLSVDYIIPSALDKSVASAVADAVAAEWLKSGK